MSRKKRAKPYDPAADARHRAERAENAEMVKTIKAQPSTAVNVDSRTGRLTGAWRLNCFNTLLPQKSAERSAVDWLDDLVRTANGENGQERRPDHIRASTEGAPGQSISDAMIEASRKLEVVTSHMPSKHARMLLELLKPDEDLITRWRPVVERCTKEATPHGQAAAVRTACATLAHIKDTMPRLMREMSERKQAA